MCRDGAVSTARGNDDQVFMGAQVYRMSRQQSKQMARMHGGWRMRVSGRHFWPLAGAIVFSIGLALRVGATINPATSNKVIIYPTAQDSIAHSNKRGLRTFRTMGPTGWRRRPTNRSRR